MQVQIIRIKSKDEIKELLYNYQSYLQDLSKWERGYWGWKWDMALETFSSNNNDSYNPETEDFILLIHNKYPIAFGFGEKKNSNYCIDIIEVSIVYRNLRLSNLVMITLIKIGNKRGAKGFKLQVLRGQGNNLSEEDNQRERKLEDMYTHWGFIKKNGKYFTKSPKIKIPNKIEIISEDIKLNR